jgi:uncharacterized protein (DUF2126 family)
MSLLQMPLRAGSAFLAPALPANRFTGALLHDRRLPPHFVAQDIRDVTGDLPAFEEH